LETPATTIQGFDGPAKEISRIFPRTPFHFLRDEILIFPDGLLPGLSGNARNALKAQ
jgi:hypothetical protein